MPDKHTKAPLARFVALFVAILIAFSAMRMASADALPLTSQASDTMNVLHTHYLRSTADVSTSEQGNIGGERRLVIGLAGLEGLSARLHQSVIKIFAKLRVQWWLWRQQQKSPDDAFKSLHLDEVKGSVFKNPKFPAWKYFVEKTNPEGDVFRVMFETMVRVFVNEDALVKVLGQAKGSQGDTVERLRDYQIKRWVQRQETAESLFDRLNLNKPLDINYVRVQKPFKQFDSPKFTMLGAFITKTNLGYHTVFEHLRGSSVDTDLMKALALVRKDDENYHFAQGLLYSHLQHMRLQKVDMHEFYDALKLKKLWLRKLLIQRFGQSLEKNGFQWVGRKISKRGNIEADDEELVRLWLDYVYMRSLNEDGSISSTKVNNVLDKALGSKKGTPMMELQMAELQTSVDRLQRKLVEYNLLSGNPTA